MDDEFPDPDEEFEMRYADEMELMNELGNCKRKPLKVNFANCCFIQSCVEYDDDKAPIMPRGNDFKVKKSLKFNDGASCSSRSGSSLAGRTPTPDESARKRQQDEVFGSLSDDEDLCEKSKISLLLYTLICIF